MSDYGASTHKKHRTRRLVLGMLFWGLVLFTAYKLFAHPSGPTISPLSDEPHTSFISALFTKTKKSEDLKRKVQNAAKGWLNYSVVVADLQSPFRMDINDTIIYTAGSVIKIPVLAALYYYAQQGDINLDEVITLQASDIVDYGTGSIRYDPPGTTYSIKTLAQLMIKQSDNTAVSILTNNVVGANKIQSLIASWGLTQTDIVNNKTSNRDISLLMEKIYTGKVANPAATQEMLGFMKETDFEDRLPALLPTGVTVYHKIGTEERVIHDVGIVTNGKTTYYIGVFTGDVADETAAGGLIAQISKVVYDFMQ